LKQAIYEIRLPARVAVTAGLADFQAALGADFTEFEDNQQLVIAPGKSEGAAAFSNPTTGDKVSVSASVLNINSPRYGGYANFRRRVEELCEAFDGVLRGGRDPIRVGLRYVNNIEASAWGSAPLDDVLDSPLGHSYPGFSSIQEMAIHLTYQRDGLQIIERGGLLTVPEGERPMYIIDVDVAMVGRIPWNTRVDQWERIHDAAKTAFLRHLKPGALEALFGGAGHAQ
jgi:uncharacterized protein (TIGR04255 family)